MSRIQDTFASLKSAQKKALVPFITAGDPNPEATVMILHAMVAAGADMIELGMPFSDPMADGPVIQAADERALAGHTNVQTALDIVQAFRKNDAKTPIILMGYLNPIIAFGYHDFAQTAKNVGVDGVLLVDLPVDAEDELHQALVDNELDCIYLLSPTTTQTRTQQIITSARGYLYYISLKGVTGSGNLDIADVEKHVASIKSQTDLPVLVGFGIKDASTAKALGNIADGVIVGSALVQHIADHQTTPQLAADKISALLTAIRTELG